MALRALQGPTGGGAPVGGSGTTNTIPRWTGPSTLGDSIIVQNAGGTAIAIGDAAGVSYVGLVQVKRAGGAGWLTLDHTGGSYAEVQSYNVPLYLNRQGNNTILNATSGNVGIGTASPWSKISAVTANGADTVSVGFSFDSANNYRSGISTNWSSASASGNLMGFLVSNATPTGFTRVMTLNGAGQAAIGTSSFTSGCSLTVAQSIDASQSAQGLKLPATPGNADAQTLDCYQENTWTPTLSAAATWGGTQPTVTSARYTRIGRMVFCEVKLDLVAGFSVTYGSTTITGPFNAGAETAVPVSYGATGQIGAQASGSTTVYLPTVASTQLARITWSFSI